MRISGALLPLFLFLITFYWISSFWANSDRSTVGLSVEDAQTALYFGFLISIGIFFRAIRDCFVRGGDYPKHILRQNELKTDQIKCTTFTRSPFHLFVYILLFAILVVAPIVSALHIRGYLPKLSGSPYSGYMSELLPANKSVNNRNIAQKHQDARSLVFQINEVSLLYSMSPVGMIQRNFDSQKDARAWLGEKTGVNFLLWGSIDSPVLELQTFKNTLSALIPTYRKRNTLKRCNTSNVIEISIPEIVPKSLCFVISPQYFIMPFSNLNLSRHFVSFFSEGLYRLNNYAVNQDGNLPPKEYKNNPGEWLQNPFLEAIELLGDWEDRTPLAVASFFAANIEFISALQEEQPKRGHLKCAIYLYANAIKNADSKRASHIAIAAFNNAAIARMLFAKTSKDLFIVKSWFRRAIRNRAFTKNNRTGTALSQIAAENFRNLKITGIIE